MLDWIKRGLGPTIINPQRLKASILKDDYEEFVRWAWSIIVPEKLTWNWHMSEMCQRLQYRIERVLKGLPCDQDLLINVPPGTSKSLLCSVMTAPWVWAKDPTIRFICASYSYELSLDLSMKARKLVESEEYRAMFPHVQIAPDQNRQSLFATTKGGSRYATSLGGSVIGKHAHVIILDDIVDPKRVASPAELDSANKWVSQEVSMRKVDKLTTLTILVMQRLGIMDPAAVMLANGNVDKLILPGEDKYPIHPPALKQMYKDGLLDPKRLPRFVLDKLHKTLGKFGYAGQIGQCLVAGTMVSTSHGLVPIEQIQKGVHVHTRKGLKRVLWAGETKKVNRIVSVLFSNGNVVSGTPDHPVYTHRGWIGLESLNESDRIVCNNPPSEGIQCELQFGSMGESIDQDQKTGTFGQEWGADLSTSTKLFGNGTKDVYPMGVSFTTRTKTHITIELTIWNVSQEKSTEEFMQRQGGCIHESIVTLCERSVDSVCIGTKLKLDKNNIEKMVNDFGNVLNTSLTFVIGVNPSLGQDVFVLQNIVLPNVSLKEMSLSENLEDTRKIVHGVMSNSLQVTIGQTAVPSSVGLMLSTVPVYDLTVEDESEFFANGVLVHNSPLPAEGGMFVTDKFRRFGPYPECVRFCRYWDKAGTLGGGNWTCGVLLGADKDNRFRVYDMERFQLDSFARDEHILSTAVQDGTDVIIGLEQEGGSGGKQSVEISIRKMAGWNIKKIKPNRHTAKGGKVGRADPWSVQVNAGNVYLDPGLWNEDFINEHMYFPFGTFDDIVDSCVGAFTVIAQPVKRRVGGMTASTKYAGGLGIKSRK